MMTHPAALAPTTVAQLREKTNAYKLSQLIFSADEVGIFDRLAERGDRLGPLAERLGLEPRRLEPVLNALVLYGLVIKDNDIYQLSEFRDILDPVSALSQRGYIGYARKVRDYWLGLSDALTESGRARENFISITGGNREVTHDFIMAMDANARPQAMYLAKHFDFVGRKILDIGAGAGTYSKAVASAYPTSSGVMLELPGVIPFIESEKGAASDRFVAIAGDYNRGLPEGLYNDIFLFAVVHQQGAIDNARLLGEIHAKLEAGGRLFLSSFFLNEDRVSPEFSTMFAVEMVVMVNDGKVYTHAEIVALLSGAGFQKVERVDEVPGPATLYVAHKN